jgi:hypothetical protein
MVERKTGKVRPLPDKLRTVITLALGHFIRCVVVCVCLLELRGWFPIIGGMLGFAFLSVCAFAPPVLRSAPSLTPQYACTPIMSAEASEGEQLPSQLLDALPKVAAASVLGATLFHAPAFAQFASQWQAISAAGVTGDDFSAPLQFWAFFAAMHPLLQPAIWIGEVLHGSPGPQIADVMPISFLLLNVVVIGALTTLSELRTTLTIGLLAAFIHYVGCGLEGTKDLAEYNLALDDGIKGCPTYEQVRQPSMQGFDVSKYTGRWYEHYFHDYTQFSDVYDTTLDIELSNDRKRWLDDFALRGPSPEAAPKSWDKSPVANGAHYFLYGRIDGQTPGVLQESGFGVTFPNYIVDVQKDENGAYTEAIQFQCLERGGVRIFEGINFLSRTPEMSPTASAAMFERAKTAGMAPYGATAEQMHFVPHRTPSDPPLDNSWQGLWRGIGFDKLLGLVESSTHSAFEDTTNPLG